MPECCTPWSSCHKKTAGKQFVSSIQRDMTAGLFLQKPSNVCHKHGCHNILPSGEAAAIPRLHAKMTETEKYSSWIDDRKPEVFIAGRAVYQVTFGEGSRRPALPGVPRGPCREQWAWPVAGNPSNCQGPVLSLVKQTGDVTVDYACVKENIPAENTFEIEKYFTSENGAVLRNSCSGEDRQASVDVNFPLLMTHGQAAFGGHETGLLERHP